MPAARLHRAIVLCAGFGTRLHPLTADTPKPLVEVAGRPILNYLLDQLVAWPLLEQIAVVTNSAHPEAWASWAADWKSRLDTAGVALSLLDDGVTGPAEALGAVGDLQFALQHTGADTPALVVAGDSIFRLSLAPVRAAFQETGTAQALALHENDPAHLRQTSVFDLSEDGFVQGLTHGPATSEPAWTSPACYALPPTALQHVAPYLQQGGDADSLGAFLHDLAQHQRVEAVCGPRRPGLRMHINTPEAHAEADRALRDAPVLLHRG
ncbi:MAG: NTP transferase domain-containing protein [Bacteroidetes bacterium]|jgi:NDP-sugar pyrophosphorylase family protein|nr:NTP transferase domain-containing protein [Bacteroidota bacterium]